jgi:predicted DCC family thiol-disulfide oxidoreductase YuxK
MGLSAMDRPIVLYDGFCKLCHTSVRILLHIDKKQRFGYIPLQSDKGKALTASKQNLPDSVILIHSGTFYLRSDAILKTAEILGYPYKLLIVFRIIPKRIRDYLYDRIANARYRIFGKTKACNAMPENKKRVQNYWTPLKKYPE